MKLSTRAKYGLKALIDLGLYSEKEAVSLQSIAGRQNISVSYLEQLMALLKKAGLVFIFVIEQSKITYYGIYTLFETLSENAI